MNACPAFGVPERSVNSPSMPTMVPDARLSRSVSAAVKVAAVKSLGSVPSVVRSPLPSQ